MLIHRGNTLKAHQHISYSVVAAVTLLSSIVLYKEMTLKKKFIQYLIKIFTKSPRRIKLHIFSKISRSVACPLSCVQLISLFLYEKNHFFI